MKRVTQHRVVIALSTLASLGNGFTGVPTQGGRRVPGRHLSGGSSRSTSTTRITQHNFLPPYLLLHRGRSQRYLSKKEYDADEDVNVYDMPMARSGGDTDTSFGSSSKIWRPQLRTIIAVVATLGALETGFLTFQKLSGVDMDTLSLCGVDGACGDVLQGPYSNLPFTNVPLSLLGFLAYLTVAFLALEPLLFVKQDTGGENRVALTTVTTAMATFSVCLMILLFGVLQTSCPYCIFSAVCSTLLAMLAWIGGCLPTTSRGNAPTAGFLASTVGAVLLFVSANISTDADASSFSLGLPVASPSSSTTTTLLASLKGKSQTDDSMLLRPPEITTESSPRALRLATQLQAMDAKMYGAYWCSHCFDQKEILGKQAFARIPYVECSKDGVNSQNKLCRAQQIPGYPTWEIQGTLYPGEQSLEELEELVQKIQDGNAASSEASS